MLWRCIAWIPFASKTVIGTRHSTQDPSLDEMFDPEPNCAWRLAPTR
jgi:hypothetical protein